MPPPSRTRRILKWMGSVFCVLVTVAWAISQRHWTTIPIGNRCAIAIVKGTIAIEVDEQNGPSLEGRVARVAWGLEDPDGNYLRRWGSVSNFDVYIPLWLPLLLTALPTAWLWHRDRRRNFPGHCPRCGYDLTGNTSGVCSECGTPFAAAAAAPEQPSGR